MDEHKIVYYVEGMRCPSCETIIETRIGQIPGIKSVNASTASGTVTIETNGAVLSVDEMNRIFKKNGYVFFENANHKKNKNGNNIIGAVFISGAIITAFLLLNRLGISRLVVLNSSSSLVGLFLFGLIAGFSTCAALVGGIVLSLSAGSKRNSSENNTITGSFNSQLLFNLGRILSYAAFGFALGLIGRGLQLSPALGAGAVILVSLIMVIVGLNMLGFKWFSRLIPRMPKRFSRLTSKEGRPDGQLLPLIIGALTIILPCGFTITAQGLALLSGDPLKGLMIMLVFVLGTTPGLLIIGFAGEKLSNSQYAGKFSIIAGSLILFFALFNINAQMNVLGLPSVNDVSAPVVKENNQGSVKYPNDLPLIIDGKQVVKMDASSYGYSPNRIKVRVNVPVRWEITDKGTGGCTNAVIARDFFNDSISLTPGEISVKEFTPTKIGKYKFSCWMGMIVGTIEVVDSPSL